MKSKSNMLSLNILLKFLLGLSLFILIIICKTDAYTGLIPADPEKPGKCIYRGDLLDVGTHKGLAPCQRLICRQDGTILVEGCGKLWLQNCNRGERKFRDKLYPECCLLIYKCKNPDGSFYYIEKDATEENESQNENSI